MDILQTKRTWQHGWILALALLSLTVPVCSSVLGSPSEGQQIAGLVFGLVCAGGSLVGNRVQTPTWSRWLSMVLASFSALFCAYQLIGLIGLCGAHVLWGACAP